MRTPSEVAPLQVVTFRCGFVANWIVVTRLLDIEARGGVFELVGHQFRVRPGSALTDGDRAFLRAHRDEAYGCIAHYAHEEHPQ